MRVVIIEDEILAQEELTRLLVKNFPDIEIDATLDSVEDSIKWFNQNTTDLIFMDIHLADGISFDIFDAVNIDIPIIFASAYDQYAIKAFDVNGIAYILKPIDEHKLVEAVQRYKKQTLDSVMLANILGKFKETPKYKTRILVKLGDQIDFINISEVAYFYADERITFLVQNDGKRHIVDNSIEALEAVLDPATFFRVTRGCICSISSVNKVSKHFNSRLKLTLIPEYEKEILISRVKVQEFLKWLDGE